MFRGFDRTKYDLRDPSTAHAMRRDRALHEAAMRTVQRHLNTKMPVQSGPRVAQVLVPSQQDPMRGIALPPRSSLARQIMLWPNQSHQSHKKF